MVRVFILSPKGFQELARKNLALELMAYGVVDIEYRRISCQYPGYNLMFKVQENSRFPVYLAIVIIYQAGQSEITAVEIWLEDCKQWQGMGKAFGAVWDISNPPEGSITERIW
ncbi:hypothetical protein Syun_018622 [Stephania yunnanensis]|uniref:Expansin-like CBD domain-containing protein n=1 Tax=Stephania yunnanensis TaxID=152371 RepID=A0AAP0ITQ3_9MAGN